MVTHSEFETKPSPSGTNTGGAVKIATRDRYIPSGDGQRLAGYLAERMVVNLEKRLLAIDLDSILRPFVQRPGVQEWVGEHAGKWLHAAALYWRHVGDGRLKAKMIYVAGTLMSAQEADGYLGTYLPADRWTSWDVWSHKYNLIGLLAYYETFGDVEALRACRRAADLLCATFGEDKRDIIASGTHVGMAPTSVLEPMVRLYQVTGDAKYLKFCSYLVRSWDQPHGPRLVSSLLAHGRVDQTANGKAYEMMSNLVGLLDFYRVTSTEEYLQAVLRAWRDIRDRQTYVTGTSSWAEHFQPAAGLNLGGAMQGQKFVAAGEGCVTVTWMQLNWELLKLTGESIYADELERSIYNALLAAQSQADGSVTYFLPMLGRKRYGEVTHGIGPDVCCCASSIPRGIAWLPEFGIGTIDGAAALLNYGAGHFRLSLGGVAEPIGFDVAGDFPHDGNVVVSITLDAPREFPLLLRVPAWCASYVVRVNNERLVGNPGSFLRIDRRWESGDALYIELDLSIFTTSVGAGNEHWTAVQRGPQVLAADAALADAAEPSRRCGPQCYRVAGSQNGQPVTLNLVPFAEVGQAKTEYESAFQNLALPLCDAARELAGYRAELVAFRTEFGGARELPDVRFFLFGMGHRTKLLYRDGRLIDAATGSVLREWSVRSDIILPSEYTVVMELVDGRTLIICENAEGVWVQEGDCREHVPGTISSVHLPRFTGHRFARILRVLHQELLINITSAGPVPNFFVYAKSWLRDSAMMAMAFKKTNNLGLIREWILGLKEPYDRNNAGEMEADNLGQALFLISLVSDRHHPLVPKILAEIPRFERQSLHGPFILGRSDFADHPVYQTKWLKFGLNALGLPDPYVIPWVTDSYSALFWMRFRDVHVSGDDSDNRDAYPYLGWACDHFHGEKRSPIGNRDYPLTWEQRASQANYEALAALDPQYVREKLSAPHTWHAAEVFLYVLALGETKGLSHSDRET